MIEALQQLKYEKSTVVNHTDRALLASNRVDWRDLNLVSPSTSSTVLLKNKGGCEKDGNAGEEEAKWEEMLRRGSDSSEWTDDSPIMKRSFEQRSALQLLPVSLATKARREMGGYTMATHVLTLPPLQNAIKGC